MKARTDEMTFAKIASDFRAKARARDGVAFDAEQTRALLERGFLQWLAGQDTHDLLTMERERKEAERFRPAAFSPKTLADRWQISSAQVLKLIAAGKLPAFKLGDTLWRILAETVERYERGMMDDWDGETSR